MKNIATRLILSVAAGFAAICSGQAEQAKPPADRTFGDWVFHCTTTNDGGTACGLHQKIMSADTRLPIAAFAIARNPASHELRLAAILPLGLDIPAGVSGKAGAAPLSFAIQTCVKRGCIASTAVDERLLEALHGNEALTATFKMRSVTEPVTIAVSLKGLDDGLKALAAP